MVKLTLYIVAISIRLAGPILWQNFTLEHLQQPLQNGFVKRGDSKRRERVYKASNFFAFVAFV